jgi:hypothetical protein
MHCPLYSFECKSPRQFKSDEEEKSYIVADGYQNQEMKDTFRGLLMRTQGSLVVDDTIDIYYVQE